MRAISISADQVLSAGGLVLPGDYVDIIAVFNVKNSQGDEEEAYFVRTILQNVQVVAVAQKLADTPAAGDESGKKSDSKPDPEATTLTILATPEQAEFVFLAESNGTLRAVLRSYGDAGTETPRPIVETELWPAGMPLPPARQQ
jgi:pilus assembly protein CpaB